MLTFHKLSLDGFGSYDKLKDLPLDEPGTTFINGPIGSGKSTIPRAISLLLFGGLLGGKSEFVSVKDYANKMQNKGYDISLEYSVGEDYYIVREIRDRKVDGESGLFFKKNGKDIRDKGDLETRKKILGSLNISIEDFKNIAILSRRQSQQLVHGKSSDRARAIVEVFGLEKHDNSIIRCDEDVKDLSKNKELMIGKIKNYEESVESLERSLIPSGENIEKVVESKVGDLKTKIVEVQDKLDKIREKELDVREFLGKADALKEQKEKARKLDVEIDGLRTKLNDVGEPEKSLDLINSEMEELKEKRVKADLEIKHMRGEIEKINNLGNKCPVNNEECPSDIPTIYKEESLGGFEFGLKKCSVLSSDLNSCIGKLKELESEVERYDNINVKVDQLVVLRDSLLIEDVSDVEEKKSLLEKCKDGKRRGNARLEELQAELSTADSINIQIKQREIFERETRELVEEKKRSVTEFESELEEMSMELRYLSAASAVFKRAKMYKIDLVLDLLEENSNKILDRIAGGERKITLASQKKDSKGKKSLDKLGVMVHDSYKSLPVELVSDGQETQVGLALLFGMWKTANTLSDKAVSLLFLDEVFGPLHRDIVNDVLAAIVEVIQEIGAKSVYIISHRDLDIRLFNREFRTSLNNGISDLEIIYLEETSYGRNDESREEKREVG